MIKRGNMQIASIPGISKIYLGDSLVFGGSIIPPEYTRLQYISASGASALETGILVAENDKIQVRFSLSNLSAGGDKHIISCRAGYTGVGLWVENYGSANTWYVRFGSTSSASTAPTQEQTSGEHSFELRKQWFGIDGSRVLVPNFSSMPSTTLNVGGRIAVNGTTATGFYGNLYNVKVLDENDVLRWHGIPVKETNGTGVGMYDVVSGQFFASVSSTPFTAGPTYE